MHKQEKERERERKNKPQGKGSRGNKIMVEEGEGELWSQTLNIDTSKYQIYLHNKCNYIKNAKYIKIKTKQSPLQSVYNIIQATLVCMPHFVFFF